MVGEVARVIFVAVLAIVGVLMGVSKATVSPSGSAPVLSPTTSGYGLSGVVRVRPIVACSPAIRRIAGVATPSVKGAPFGVAVIDRACALRPLSVRALTRIV